MLSAFIKRIAILTGSIKHQQLSFAKYGEIRQINYGSSNIIVYLYNILYSYIWIMAFKNSKNLSLVGMKKAWFM